MALFTTGNRGKNRIMRLIDFVFCVLCFFPSDSEKEKIIVSRIFWPAIVASQKM